MSDYIIAQEDINRVRLALLTDLPKLRMGTVVTKNQINTLAFMGAFKGKTAESMKAYMSEVHGSTMEHVRRFLPCFLLWRRLTEKVF